MSYTKGGHNTIPSTTQVVCTQYLTDPAPGELRSFEIVNKSFMMIFLLEECNFACPHCVREDEPMDIGYRLSFRQLQSCLSDCRGLGSIRTVHFSGGETTLWREGELDLLDLLIEIAASGFTPGFITNGSSFHEYERCYDFFRRYVEGQACT